MCWLFFNNYALPSDTYSGLGVEISFPDKDERVSEDISQAKIPGTARWTETMEGTSLW